MTRPFTSYHYFWPSDLKLWITYTKCCYLNLVAFRRTLLSSDNSNCCILQYLHHMIFIVSDSKNALNELKLINKSKKLKVKCKIRKHCGYLCLGIIFMWDKFSWWYIVYKKNFLHDDKPPLTLIRELYCYDEIFSHVENLIKIFGTFSLSENNHIHNNVTKNNYQDLTNVTPSSFVICNIILKNYVEVITSTCHVNEHVLLVCKDVWHCSLVLRMLKVNILKYVGRSKSSETSLISHLIYDWFT